MQEDFLHYVWQYQKFNSKLLKTVLGEELQVLSVGLANTNSGPDFFNARIVINQQEWAGNVEIHVKSSDWYAHYHETDESYDNVILHVVWEDDVAIFDTYEKPIKTLELKNYIAKGLVVSYKKLLNSKSWINCQSQINNIDGVVFTSLKDSLLVTRLERKAASIQEKLERCQFNWEAILFERLTQAFGLKVNTDMFEQLAKSISFSVFKKEASEVIRLEALLYGQANMLSRSLEDAYVAQLQKDYAFLKQKYKLQPIIGQMQFFRMRPPNFPTIRLSQLANLYHINRNLFSKVIRTNSIADIKDLFAVHASEYWDTHFTFGKTSNNNKKRLSSSFVVILMLNVILPLKYVYSKVMGETNFDAIFMLYKSLQPEKNNVISKFKDLNIEVEHAGDTQALLELKHYFCDQNKCLNCKIGNKLLYQ